MTIRFAAALFLVLLAIAGCGGGGGGGGSGTSEPIPTGAPINLSGTATFDRVPTTTGAGLDYAGTVVRPIRGAIIEVRSSGGTHVLYRAVTDDTTGAFTVQAPSNATVRLVVLAAMGTPTAPETKVIDNARGNAQYGTYITVTTALIDLTGQDVHAGSGWGGSGYTGSRSAAPFAILDTAHDVRALITGVDSGATLHPMVVGWSNLNDGARIGTSHFLPSSGGLFILGEENGDTDEYDDHVIAHEMGHWFEHYYSRSDSVGGPHSTGDILDERIAFGEGFGNAFSGMVSNDPAYVDTKGIGQTQTALYIDLEADRILDSTLTGAPGSRTVDGGWSEASIEEILWDVFDAANDDALALGFEPIYNAMLLQRTTPGFTTLYSFLTHLKAQSGVSAVDVNNLAAAEGVGSFDLFEDAAWPRYTTLPDNGTVVTHDVDSDPLTTWASFGPISSGSPGNKLYNWMLFKATITAPGNYTLRVSPNTGGDVVIVRGGGLPPTGWVDQYYGADERLNFSAAGGDVVTFAVGSVANATFSNGETPFTIRLGAPGVVGKPVSAQPAPEADELQAPQSNG